MLNKKSILLILLFVLLAFPVQSHVRKGCVSRDPVYCQITERSPNINRKYARRLSFTIRSASKRHDVPPRVLTAILGAESSFRLNVVNKDADFGIAQVNIHNIRAYKFDKNRLVTDLRYSVNAGAKVLYWFKDTYSAKEEQWYLRYNCGVHKNLNRKACVQYSQALSKWW